MAAEFYVAKGLKFDFCLHWFSSCVLCMTEILNGGQTSILSTTVLNPESDRVGQICSTSILAKLESNIIEFTSTVHDYFSFPLMFPLISSIAETSNMGRGYGRKAILFVIDSPLIRHSKFIRHKIFHRMLYMCLYFQYEGPGLIRYI